MYKPNLGMGILPKFAANDLVKSRCLRGSQPVPNIERPPKYIAEVITTNKKYWPTDSREKILNFEQIEIKMKRKIDPAKVIPNSKLLKKAKVVNIAEVTT